MSHPTKPPQKEHPTKSSLGVLRLRLPGVLRELASGEGELRLPVPDAGQTLGDVLDAVARDWPVLSRRLRDETGTLRRHVNVFVDGEDVRRGEGLGTPVRPGAVVHVLPSVAGG